MDRKKRITLLFVLAGALVTPPLQARFYKYVDENGVVHYTDRKPAVDAELVKPKTNLYSPPSLSGQPSAGKSAKGKKEVVMYSATWCGVCKRAEKYMRERGISFKEYDVEKSAKGRRDYKKLNGRGVPIILVGDQRMNGFSSTRLEQMLKTASR